MKKTKNLTFCAIMAALGVVILFIGSFIEIFDLCSVLISSLLIFIVAEELGNSKASLTYLVVAVIAFLLCPSKIVAVEYAIFGIYPVIRRLFERCPKIVCIALKAAYMIASTLAMVLISKFFFTTEDSESKWLTLALFACGILCLIICDVVFKRFSRLYNVKMRKMLRIDKFFS